MQEEYITNEAWMKILDFFIKHPRVNVCNEEKLKLFMDAVYWVKHSGAQWRFLPKEYGNWNSVYKRFRSWVKKGVWRDLFRDCIKDPDLEYIMLDSTTVRAHACSAGLGKQEKSGLGRSRGGFTTKVHAKVDALGNPLDFLITPGQVSDHTVAENILGNVSGAYVLCDKGYDSDKFREKIRAQDCIPVIPGKSNRKVKIEYDEHIYQDRNLIERFFSKMKYHRRLATRFDKSLDSYMAFWYFAGALLWLK